MSGIHTIHDARRKARRRLPRLVFDYIDGGAGDEYLRALNEDALERIRLQPRVLVNVARRSLAREFLGRSWGLPFGIAPMGMCNLSWPGADEMLARAARRHEIPLGLSTLASTRLERSTELSGESAWFQLYVGQSEEVAMTLVERAERAGIEVLMLTVDVPEVAQRPRDLRNGFTMPFRIGPRQFLDFALHPVWSLSTLSRGAPNTENVLPAAGGKAMSRNESRGAIDFDFLARLRQRWQGKLLVKGVLSPVDAVAVMNTGVDGLYVSNHGGRQLDSAPAAIEALPAIRAAVGPDFPLVFDSGVRNGESVIKALALGADFVMLGRPFLYGIGAGGEQGLERVIELLSSQVDLALAQLGLTAAEAIDHRVLVNATEAPDEAGADPGLRALTGHTA